MPLSYNMLRRASCEGDTRYAGRTTLFVSNLMPFVPAASGPEGLADPLVHLVVGNRRDAIGCILRVDHIFDLDNARVMLGDLDLVMGLDPVLDAGGAGLVGDGHADGPVQQLVRVEAVVDLFVLEQSVGVDARPRHVEVLADQRVVPRDLEAELRVGVCGQLGDRGVVDAGDHALELGVLDDQGFQRRVARPLAGAEDGGVGGAAPIEPCGRGVDQDLVEVVVPVPFELGGLDADLAEALNQLGNAPRQRHARPGQAEAQRVAQADLDRLAVLLLDLHQLGRERQDEPVVIGPGDVFQVAARQHAGVQGGLDDVQVAVQSLGPRLAQLEEHVVVAGGRQNAGFLQAELGTSLKSAATARIQPVISGNL